LKRLFAIMVASGISAGCASKPAAVPTPIPPAPAGAGTPALIDRCPDASDGPSVIATAIEYTYRELQSDASAKLPPGCVVLGFARIAGPVPDSLVAHALVVGTAHERRASDVRDARIGEIALFARTKRFTELSSAYDRLSSVDTQPPYDVVRFAAAAARSRGDSGALLRIVTKAGARSDAPGSLRNEANVLRQITPLLAAINQARGLIRQNPKYTAGYPSIVANFGTLGQADSVVAYVSRGLAQGATRSALSASVESFVNAVQRHATLYAMTFDWDAAITHAMRVDSVLPSSATKYLVASLRVQSAGPRISRAEELVNGVSWWPPGRDAATAPSTRGEGCAQLAPIDASLGVAQSAMTAGGDGYATGAAELRGALFSARAAVARLREVCGV
jgi:hypothetical protein